MNKRFCYKCRRPAGPGHRELRPYGPSGSDVCAGCVFGEDGKSLNVEMEKEAKKQLTILLSTPDTLYLDPTEQVGPRLLYPKGKA